MEYYSIIEKNEIMPFATTWMDLEIIILSEVCQKKTNIMILLYVEPKKWYKCTYLQNRSRLTDRKQIYGYQKGNVAGRDKLGVWD